MTLPALQAWILALCLHFAPISHLPQYPGHEETEQESLSRYRDIARDIAGVVGTGTNARDHAALLVALAVGESGLARDADLGPCYRGKDRHSALRKRCDGGLAGGLWQLHALPDLPLLEIFAHRDRAGARVLRLAVGAFQACSRLAPEDRLSGMGLGHCEAGNKSVQARYKLYKRMQAWVPPREDARVAGR